MQVHTKESMRVSDAIEVLETSLYPIYVRWLDRDDHELLDAADALAEMAHELAVALVDHGRFHAWTIAVAQRTYVLTLALLRRLAEETAPRPLVEGAIVACIDFLDVPAELGHNTCRQSERVTDAHLAVEADR